MAASTISAGLDRRGQPHRRELLGAADAAALGQHAGGARRFRASRWRRSACLALLAQPGGAGLDDVARDLRHPRRRRAGRAGSRGRRADKSARILPRGRASWRTSRRFRSGSRQSGRRRTRCPGRNSHILAEIDHIVARMPALHALQDHVVARLQRQVQVRHQPRLRRPALPTDPRRPRPDRWTTAGAASGPARAAGTSLPSRPRLGAYIVMSTPVRTTSRIAVATSARTWATIFACRQEPIPRP